MTNIIRDIRESAGLSQKALADKVGFSRTKIFNLETKPEKRVTLPDIDKLAGVLAESVNVAYVAGLFDRASTMTIVRVDPYKIHDYQKSPSYIAQIRFTSKHRILCEIIRKILGVGEVCIVKNWGSNPRNIGWMYYAFSASADTVLEKLLPYLRVKRQKALVLQEFRKYLSEQRDKYRQENGGGKKFEFVYTTAVPKHQWWSTATTVEKSRLGRSHLHKLLGEGRLKAEKVDGIWKIHPFKLVKCEKGTLSKAVIKKYEYYYNRIREV